MAYRPKIAAVVTAYHKYSHAQHIVDRFLEGYGWENRHHYPAMVSIAYVEQVGDNDLSQDRAERFQNLKIYPTVADALTLGGDSLAVDGVLLIGEHGDYPTNEKVKDSTLAMSYTRKLSMSTKLVEKQLLSSMISTYLGIGTGAKRCMTNLNS